MSDSPAKTEEATPKKKKGKLPIIIIIALVLFGGGFFGMKKMGGKKPTKPEIKLAAGEKAIVELEEKLYNLADRTTFLRTTIALHPKDGFDPKVLESQLPVVEDAILQVLTDKMPDEVIGAKHIQELKRDLVAAINGVIKDPKDEEKHEKESHDEKGGGKDGHEKKVVAKKAEPEKPAHPEWESQTGPILRLYFRAFAIQ